MKSSLTILRRINLGLLCMCSLTLMVGSIKALPNAWSRPTKSLDAPLSYTVKVVSKQYGNVAETRAIASGAMDDFSWKTQPPTGAALVDLRCPHIDSLPLNANYEMLQQIKVRLAPVIGLNNMVSIQLSFSAHTPQGSYAHQLEKGVEIYCPVDHAHQEVVRFEMPLNGQLKKIVLADGTVIIVKVKQ